MKKKTNNHRKCAYCPHHENQKSCCCQPSRSRNNTKNSSVTRSRPKKKNLNSSVSYINTTLPISQINNSVMHPGSNVMIENSILRTENDMLKREINNQSQFHNVSIFTKEDMNLTTHPSSEYETARTYRLQDKLFYSNKNLQEVLI